MQGASLPLVDELVLVLVEPFQVPRTGSDSGRWIVLNLNRKDKDG